MTGVHVQDEIGRILHGGSELLDDNLSQDSKPGSVCNW